MAVDIEWVRENPEEAARQLDMLKNMSSDIQLMTSFVSEGRWPELTMLSSNPELAKLGEALNKLQVKHLTQVVDLVDQREQYRTAEEHQVALRKKMQEEMDEIECQIEEAGRYLRDTVFRDAQTQADNLSECIGEITSEALKAHSKGLQYTADMAAEVLSRKCFALRQKAKGVAQ